jgi:hypothetical protein
MVSPLCKMRNRTKSANFHLMSDIAPHTETLRTEKVQTISTGHFGSACMKARP